MGTPGAGIPSNRAIARSRMSCGSVIPHFSDRISSWVTPRRHTAILQQTPWASSLTRRVMVFFSLCPVQSWIWLVRMLDPGPGRFGHRFVDFEVQRCLYTKCESSLDFAEKLSTRITTTQLKASRYPETLRFISAAKSLMYFLVQKAGMKVLKSSPRSVYI